MTQKRRFAHYMDVCSYQLEISAYKLCMEIFRGCSAERVYCSVLNAHAVGRVASLHGLRIAIFNWALNRLLK